jgi:hypothetical protein
MTSSTFVDRETHRVVDPPPTVLLLVAVDPPPPRRLAASTLLPVGRSPSSLARTLAAVVGLSPSSGGPVGGWAPCKLAGVAAPPWLAAGRRRLAWAWRPLRSSGAWSPGLRRTVRSAWTLGCRLEWRKNEGKRNCCISVLSCVHCICLVIKTN